jgi:hypothetical protein
MSCAPLTRASVRSTSELGPDGALYVSDWTNPVINHGEVDFRDPRRDKVSGRIWRITSKEGKPAAWQSLWEKDTPYLLNALLSDNHWEQDQARKTLAHRLANGADTALENWRKEKGSPEANRVAAFIRAAAFGPEGALKEPPATDPAAAAWEARWRGSLGNASGNIGRLSALAKDPSPRVRIEAMRALARIPSEASAEAVASAIANTQAKDEPYFFAVKLTWRELGPFWIKALVEGRWEWKSRENELAMRLLALDADVATNVLSAVMKDLVLPPDGSGPWASLVAFAGGPAEATKVWEVVSKPNQLPEVMARGLDALLTAASRGVKPSGDTNALAGFFRPQKRRDRETRTHSRWGVENERARAQTRCCGCRNQTRAAQRRGGRFTGAGRRRRSHGSALTPRSRARTRDPTAGSGYSCQGPSRGGAQGGDHNAFKLDTALCSTACFGER